MSWLNWWQLLFPHHCVGCHLTGYDLCPNCLYGADSADPGPNPTDLALYNYRDPAIRQAIWLLKYKGVKNLATLFGAEMYRRVAEELAEWKSLYATHGACLVVPIPSSRQRRHARGFNQASEIAKALASHDSTNLIFADILLKTRETKTQVSIHGRKQRLKNLVNCFQIKKGCEIKQRPVILIDDVTTTGATFAEARRALKLAQVGPIISLAVARG